jgi:hypothetical protein
MITKKNSYRFPLSSSPDGFGNLVAYPNLISYGRRLGPRAHTYLPDNGATGLLNMRKHVQKATLKPAYTHAITPLHTNRTHTHTHTPARTYVLVCVSWQRKEKKWIHNTYVRDWYYIVLYAHTYTRTCWMKVTSQELFLTGLHVSQIRRIYKLQRKQYKEGHEISDIRKNNGMGDNSAMTSHFHLWEPEKWHFYKIKFTYKHTPVFNELTPTHTCPHSAGLLTYQSL